MSNNSKNDLSNNSRNPNENSKVTLPTFTDVRTVMNNYKKMAIVLSILLADISNDIGILMPQPAKMLMPSASTTEELNFMLKKKADTPAFSLDDKDAVVSYIKYKYPSFNIYKMVLFEYEKYFVLSITNRKGVM